MQVSGWDGKRCSEWERGSSEKTSLSLLDLGNWGGGRGGVVAVLFATRSHKHQGTEMVSSFHPRDPDRGGWGKNNLSLLLE